MLQHKGHKGYVEVDDEAGFFYGEVITFCEERGQEPNKSFSGRPVLGLTLNLHRRRYTRV